MEKLKQEMHILETKLENVAPATVEIERVMSLRNGKIQEIRERINSLEDTVFAEFCAEIGIASIRQYEERELK